MTGSGAFRSASAIAACSRSSGCKARALETSSSRVGTVMASIAVLILTRSDRGTVIAQSAFRDVHHILGSDLPVLQCVCAAEGLRRDLDCQLVTAGFQRLIQSVSGHSSLAAISSYIVAPSLDSRM